MKKVKKLQICDIHGRPIIWRIYKLERELTELMWDYIRDRRSLREFEAFAIEQAQKELRELADWINSRVVDPERPWFRQPCFTFAIKIEDPEWGRGKNRQATSERELEKKMGILKLWASRPEWASGEAGEPGKMGSGAL